MPKVTLEFEVIDKGTAVVRQVTGEVEKGMKAIGAAGAGAATGLDRTRQASDGAGVSFRTLRMGVNDMALAMGTANPAVAQIALGLGHVTDRLSGLGGGAALASVAILGIGAGVALITDRFKKMDEAIEFQTKLNDSVQRFDISGMVSQLKAVGLELETEEKKAKAFMGGLAVMQGGPEAGPAFEGTTTTMGEALASSRLEKLKQQQADIRKAIEQVASLGFEQQIIGISGQIRSAQAARTLLTSSPAAQGTEMTNVLKRQEADAKRILEIQTEIAKGQAASEDERIRIVVAASFKRLAIEEETATKISLIQKEAAATAEAQRAFGAGLSMEQQKAKITALQAETESGKKSQDWYNNYLKGLGVLIPAAIGVDPNAKQLIEEQKIAQLMAIDETLKKSLGAIDQLRAADEQKAKLVGQANALAEAQRANAISDAVSKTNDLYDAAAKTREELRQAAQDVKTDLVGGLNDAAAAAKEVADNTSVIGMSGEAFQSNAPGQSEAWKKFWATPSTGPGSPSWWSGGAWGTGTVPSSQSPASAAWNAAQPRPGALTTLGPVEAYQEGGVVPGPIGRPRMAIVHGGETITPPGSGSGGRGGSIEVHVHLDGSTIARSQRISLQEMIRSGQLIIKAA